VEKNKSKNKLKEKRKGENKGNKGVYGVKREYESYLRWKMSKLRYI
jgi:hypothetical protein